MSRKKYIKVFVFLKKEKTKKKNKQKNKKLITVCPSSTIHNLKIKNLLV